MLSKPSRAATRAARCHVACRFAACAMLARPWRRSEACTMWCAGFAIAQAVLEPIAYAVTAERPGPRGFDATLPAWRRATTAATLTFLDELTRARSCAGSR